MGLPTNEQKGRAKGVRGAEVLQEVMRAKNYWRGSWVIIRGWVLPHSG